MARHNIYCERNIAQFRKAAVAIAKKDFKGDDKWVAMISAGDKTENDTAEDPIDGGTIVVTNNTA